MTDPVLHGYWRSGAAYRVRLALNLKGVHYCQTTYDLRTAEHKSPAFLRLSPQGLVPAIEVDGLVLTQSPAILEWIEECWPTPPLLPESPSCRAIVRAMSAAIACDIHPLNNLRVLNALRDGFSISTGKIASWITTWVSQGFAALEDMVTAHGAGFCYGDRPTLADCYLIPQLYSAARFDVDVQPYPRLQAIGERMADLPPVQDAHPGNQPDASTEASSR